MSIQNKSKNNVEAAFIKGKDVNLEKVITRVEALEKKVANLELQLTDQPRANISLSSQSKVTWQNSN